MGSGKTTIGRALASAKGFPFMDLDEAVVARTGRTVGELFAESGEEGFRAEESACLKEILGRFKDRDLVLALGGGTVLKAENRSLLKAFCTTVYLKVPKEILAARLEKSGVDRPLLNLSSADALLKERLPLYESVADITVSAGELSPEETAGFLL